MNPIDLARLRDFSDGTDDGVRGFAAMFVGHMDELVTALRGAVSARNGASIREEAHRGAGTAGACGARPLAALFLDLEALGAGHRVEEAAMLMPEVELELSRLREYIDATLASDGSHGQPAAETPS